MTTSPPESPLLSQLLLDAGAVGSMNEFRRLLGQGAIRVLCGGVYDGLVYRKFVTVRDPEYVPTLTDFFKVGKRRWYRCDLDAEGTRKVLREATAIREDERETVAPPPDAVTYPGL